MTLAAMIAAGLPLSAGAQSNLDKQRDRAEEAIREGAEKIVRGLEQLLRSIPQYEAPEVQENGDIIIRRKPPKEPAEKPKSNGDNESRT
jgi:hypothetical protein